MKTRLMEGLSAGAKIRAIIDDDLSLMAVAEDKRVHFIWAPSCWDKSFYYGKLLRSL